MIGIFDSGLGGLTAYKALHALLQHEDFVYFGDTGRLPYGSRSREILTRYARQDVNFLISKGVDAILAACGTISSVVLDNIKNEYNIPITGVVDASVEEALGATKNEIVGVIGTVRPFQAARLKKNFWTPTQTSGSFPRPARCLCRWWKTDT